MLGGLAYPDDIEIQRVAVVCIQLFDSQPNDPGSLHVQSQRFLNPDWSGLDGNGMCGTSPDPPLRHLMELLANGEATLCDFFTQLQVPTGCHDQEVIAIALSKHSLLYWVSSFRLEPRLEILFCCVKPQKYHYQFLPLSVKFKALAVAAGNNNCCDI